MKNLSLEQRKDNTYYDKNGEQILEGDLLKVFHFIGARRKKYYMYQVVVMEDINFKNDPVRFPVMSVSSYLPNSNSTFNTEEEAARAYDKKALELFGEFAYQTLNFPELKEEYLKELKLCLVK